jgi:ankyrin repeat protein
MFHTIFLTGLGLLALTGSAQAQDSSSQLNPNNPPALADYRMNYRDMVELANDKKLPHRIFYTPSSGPDAKWFDAVKKGDLNSVQQMLAQGQNIEARDEAALGQTALGWAAFIGYDDLVHYLVSRGANLFAGDRADVKNVLKSAALGGDVAVFKYLHEQLGNKVDLNDTKSDQQGETLLMIAASNNRIHIVKYLLTQQVNLNVVSRTLDQDALTYACERDYQDVAALLIEAGAVNHHTGKGNCID